MAGLLLVMRGVVLTLLCVTGMPVSGHEINPTVADLSVEQGDVTLQLRLNAESFLAEINLDDVVNTDDVAEATQYGDLRQLSADQLRLRIQADEAAITGGIQVMVGDVRIPLSMSQVVVSDLGDTELPRLSLITLDGKIPQGVQAVTFRWGAGYGPLILRQQGVDDPYTGFLSGGDTSPLIRVKGGDALTASQSFVAYIPVGFDHILPKGTDHILFVLGLFFLSLHLRPLLLQVSAFTLAHTVALALGASGIVSVPASIVEPLIAASIVYVAVENILSSGLSRWRPVVVFGFGLLHGLGFASVLGEFGLPQDQFIPALLGFNIGVELGQLCVIGLAWLCVGLWFGKKSWYRSRIAIPFSAAIALVGAWWFVERVFGI